MILWDGLFQQLVDPDPKNNEDLDPKNNKDPDLKKNEDPYPENVERRAIWSFTLQSGGPGPSLPPDRNIKL